MAPAAPFLACAYCTTPDECSAKGCALFMKHGSRVGTAGVDRSEQGRNASAVLGNTMQALTEGGVPFVQALDATLKALDHPTAPSGVPGGEHG